MKDAQRPAEGMRGAKPEPSTGMTRRNLLRGLGAMAAVAPVTAAAAQDARPAATTPPIADLLDENFTSASGRGFGSQVIHFVNNANGCGRRFTARGSTRLGRWPTVCSTRLANWAAIRELKSPGAA